MVKKIITHYTVITAVALVGAAGAAAALGGLSDEFDSPALAGWNVMQGDLQDGVATNYGVAAGELTVVPGRSWWVDDVRAFYLYKDVRRDFKATVRLNVTGKSTPLPTADWSLSGLLVRKPTDDRENENWLSFRTGAVAGGAVLERKTTRRSHSDLVLDPVAPGWIELRVARIGPKFVLLRRSPGQNWKLHWVYPRFDLPAQLEVGLDAFSGFDDTKADLVSHVDYIHFAPTGVPAKLKKRYLTGRVGVRKLLPYLMR